MLLQGGFRLKPGSTETLPATCLCHVCSMASARILLGGIVAVITKFNCLANLLLDTSGSVMLHTNIDAVAIAWKCSHWVKRPDNHRTTVRKNVVGLPLSDVVDSDGGGQDIIRETNGGIRSAHFVCNIRVLLFSVLVPIQRGQKAWSELKQI